MCFILLLLAGMYAGIAAALDWLYRAEPSAPLRRSPRAFIWPLGLVPLLLGSVLTLALSRYREFSADRGSAMVTGQPERLMSALVKLDKATAVGDLRTVAPLCIVSPGRASELLMDHPRLSRRLAQLEQIARELGRPARG